MNKLTVKSSSFAMSYVLNAKNAQKAFETLHVTPSPPAYVGPMGMRVTVVNLYVRRYRSLGDYMADMNKYVAEAVNNGSCLVAFPEFTGLLALSAAAGYDTLLKEASALLDFHRDTADGFRFLCESIQGFLLDFYLNTFSVLAKTHGILIDAGSIYIAEGGFVKNRRYLFSETGAVAGIQDKLYLHPFELSAGVKAGSCLTPAQTRMGLLALLSRNAAENYEPFAIAAAMGCALAILAASPFDDTDISFLARCRAWEHRLCIAASGLSIGSDFKKSLDLRGGIYVPFETARKQNRPPSADEKEASVYARCFTSRIDPVRAAEHFDLYASDKNPRFFSDLLKPSEQPG